MVVLDLSNFICYRVSRSSCLVTPSLVQLCFLGVNGLFMFIIKKLCHHLKYYVHTLHSVIFLHLCSSRCQCLVKHRESRLCFSRTNHIHDGIPARQPNNPTSMGLCCQFPIISLQHYDGHWLPSTSRWSSKQHHLPSR